MEYTVHKLAQLAGVSARTLRYYDGIDLLKPARISTSGYRIYGQAQVARLQQILFYRELGVDLDTIREILSAPDFNGLAALSEHRERLLARRAQLDALIATVERTIADAEGRIAMSDEERFEAFKQRQVDENEAKYGAEVRAKYGAEAVECSNRAFKGMSKEQYAHMTALAEEIHSTLAAAFQQGDPTGPLARKAVELHKEWLGICWGRYNPEAHAGLAQMYVDDPRFTAYYDKDQPGTAAFLRDAVHAYLGLTRPD